MLNKLINSSNSKVVIEGISNNFIAFILQQILKSDQYQRPIIFIARDGMDLNDLGQNLKFLAPSIERFILPPWDCLPYDRVGPSTAILAQRLACLSNLITQNKACFILTSINTISQKLIPAQWLKAHIIPLSPGCIFNIEQLIVKLNSMGYQRSGAITQIGEYSVRGGLLDIYPVGEDHPYRLDFFGDKIESIRIFDVFTQRTIKETNFIKLIALSEVILNEETISNFRKNYIKNFGSANDNLYESISTNRPFIGMEHWLSFFYNKLETLYNYVPNAIAVFDHLSEQALKERHNLILDYYQARTNQTNNDYKALSPAELYLDPSQISFKKQVELSAFKSGKEFGYSIEPVRNFIAERKSPDINLFECVVNYLKQERASGKTILLTSWSAGSQTRLLQVLADHKLEKITKVNNYQALSNAQIFSAILPLETGFVYENLMILSEQDIFGDRLIRQSKKARKNTKQIFSLNNLSVGDIVVHIKHGIGKFIGLKAIEALGLVHDCIEIHYAANDRLFLPVENIELLSRYGSENSKVILDKLGGASWQTRKAKLKKQLLAIAQDLINIAAHRALQKAPHMIAPIGAYDEFIARFPYEETDDQANSIKAIITDLASGKAMDRLICGDVGFGKTEVCLRAAFIAAISGYQVAVIVPTTLLCRQHYANFKARFEGFPIEIAQLSRFCSTKERESTRNNLKSGIIDIVIGTHALFSKTVQFKELGLLIIDEEHNFGVKHKERLKELKRNIHILTLSATPIPRTLQSSLVGIKDLSLITTPPIDRLAVHSFVMPFDSLSIKEALLREYHRGGQSFFVCPHISDLSQIEEFLRKHTPELKFAVAHGQIAANQLEDIMNAFYDGKYDILLSTTIVESGLDVPNANTIIIYKADKFGLATLYQLRGRVGRSKQRAYALYSFSADKILTKDAEKRLHILQAIDGLGGGFQLASYDMDIRGAGNLLGEEQSGHIKEVGYELYQQMLEEAILQAQNKTNDIEEKWAPQININSSVFIAEDYVSDIELRLNLYQRLANVESETELEALAAEIIDRFGPIPVETENLLQTIAIKTLCKKLNIEKIDATDNGVIISFKDNNFSAPEALLNYLAQLGKTAIVRADQSIFFSSTTKNVKTRIAFTIKILKNLLELI